MTDIIYIGLGGFIGAISRYIIGTYIQNKITAMSQFPIGTFVVNILGCLLIGLIAGLIESKNMFQPSIRLFLLVGVLGGFTTFSTFAFESFNLFTFGNFLNFSINLFGQIIFGLIAVWIGLNVVRIN